MDAACAAQRARKNRGELAEFNDFHWGNSRSQDLLSWKGDLVKIKAGRGTINTYRVKKHRKIQRGVSQDLQEWGTMI